MPDIIRVCHPDGSVQAKTYRVVRLSQHQLEVQWQ